MSLASIRLGAGVAVGSALLAAGGIANAAPVTTKDFGAFTWKWEFDEAPFSGGSTGTPLDAFDSYNNITGAAGADGVNDFLRNAGATPTHANGVLSTSGNYWNRVWGNNNNATEGVRPTILTGAQGYTVEYRVRVSGTGVATNGVASYENPLDTIGFSGIRIKENAGGDQEVFYGATSPDPAPFVTVPAGEFVTIRIAAEFEDANAQKTKYTVYVNDSTTPLVVDATNKGANGGFANNARMIFGSLGTGYGGTWEMDHMGFELGAFAPVPEPTVLSLLAFAPLWALRRPRRTSH